MFQQTPSRHDWGGILLEIVTNILCKTHSKVLYNIAVVAAAAAETRCQARPPSEHSGNCSPIGRAAGHVTPPEPPVFSQTLIGNSWEEGPKFCKLFAHVLGEWKCTDLTIVWRTIWGQYYAAICKLLVWIRKVLRWILIWPRPSLCINADISRILDTNSDPADTSLTGGPRWRQMPE